MAEEFSERFATEFITGLELRFEQVLKFPFSGAPRPYFAPNLRVIFHKKYAIYYLPCETDVVIVRVLHGSRDLAAIAEQEGFTP